MFEYGTPGLDFGFMTCDSGNMFGGKTENLIRRIKRLYLQEQLREDFCKNYGKTFKPLRIGVFVNKLDVRYYDGTFEGTFLISHSGMKLPATPVGSVDELKKLVKKNQYDVVAIDEAQFFMEKNDNGEWLIVKTLKEFITNNKFILVAGLEKDFRGEPFGPTGDLMALSDEKKSHYPLCSVCGSPDATLPQRLVNGLPAFEDDPVVMVGAKESYEPRCRKHHIVRKREESVANKRQII